MTVSEKTRLLPKEYQKPYVIPIPQEDLNNNTSLISEYDSYALTKAELAKYIDDPFWNRVRYICFSVYWMACLVALLISCYLAFSALENGFCNNAGGPINGDNTSLIDSVTSATTAGSQGGTATTMTTDAIMTTMTTAAADNTGVIFRMLNQPS